MQKILIIAPAWVGDLVMAETLFKVLKKRYGANLLLDVYANSWASGLLSRMAEVDKVIHNPFTHGKLNLIKRVKEGFKLRHNHYDQVFVLPNSFKSAIIPLCAKINKRFGFVGESRYGLLNQIYKLDKHKLPLMIDRFCALANGGNKLEEIEWPKLQVDLVNQAKLIEKFNLAKDKPIIAFCPGAEYGEAKRWPSHYFAKLADMVIRENYQVIVLGSNKDAEIGSAIVKLANQVVDLCGKTSLIDVIDLLAMAKRVVTNDSGLMHVACAVDSKVIALYGSTSPQFTPPLSKDATIMQIKLECSPCFQRTCRYGHYNCLNFITPEMVFIKLNIL